MKILIAGPLPSKYKSGGVAVFTKNLAIEAQNEGNKVIILSKHKGIMCQKIKIITIWNILEVYKFKPDLIISSLEYSLLFSYFPTSAKKIHILHGFTNLKYYNFIKFFIMHLIDKIIKNKYDVLLSNSEFTEIINDEIFNIQSNGYFHIGIDGKQINKIIDCDNDYKNGLLYVGRVVPAKHVDLAIDAFLKLKTDQLFNIVGYGSEYKKLLRKYADNKNIIFKGAVGHDEVQKFFANSKVFISLNQFEPFGITYLEAIASGAFVVAPKTGGQVEILKDFPGRYSLVDINDIESIMHGIREGFKSNLSKLDNSKIRKLSYKSTFSSIIKQAQIHD